MKEKIIRGIINGNNLLEITESKTPYYIQSVYTVRLSLETGEKSELNYLDRSDAENAYVLYITHHFNKFIGNGEIEQ